MSPPQIAPGAIFTNSAFQFVRLIASRPMPTGRNASLSLVLRFVGGNDSSLSAMCFVAAPAVWWFTRSTATLSLQICDLRTTA
jgi:hypothetical protein